jgi:putative transposase
MTPVLYKTLRVRVKDKHASVLIQMARQVTFVWNYLNELSSRAIRERQQFMTAYDLQKYTAGYSKCEGVLLLAQTVDAICQEYATRRRLHKKRALRWRVSHPKSPKRSLGWVPIKGDGIKYVAGQIRYAGHFFSLWDSYGLGEHDIKSGSFSQDSRGRWYFNAVVEAEATASQGRGAIGIDLGLKTAVTVSDGQRLEGRIFRASECKLAKAQRAGKKKQARTIHAKIRNQRKDSLHKLSIALVRQNAAIFVGDVSSAKLVKTKLAKSTLDAGWSMFKTMLEYKCQQAGVVFEVVNESYTTQTCNECGVIAGPKGRAGLNKRVWRCICGAEHDRDVNAALNIRALGLESLAEGAGA